jgi:hypothetical protein
MTMLRFRVDDADVARAQLWAQRLGVDRSQLFCDALHQHLLRLAGERDAGVWAT